MASRFLAIGTLAALTAVAAAASVSSLRHPHLRPSAIPGHAPLHAFGSRGAQQRQSVAGAKFDGALADLSRHAALVRPDHAVEDLRSLAPAVRFTQTASDAAPLVLIDAVTRGDPQQLKAALVGLGLQRASMYSNDVSGWLPVTALGEAAARAEVHSMRAAMSRTRSGAVTSQGDFVQHSDVLRSAKSLTGAGVTVGVLSDSYNCYSVFAADGVAASGNAGYASNGFLATASMDVSTGDLPSTVNVLGEAQCMSQGHYLGYPLQLPFGDEGRAMLQIVHDVAPGASLAFYTAENGEADFASGIGKLAAAGAKVIADDVGYFDEPFFQDGIVAQAIDTVVANGVVYFSAAGNDGTLAYDNNAPSFLTLSSSAPNAGEYLLNFDASGATTATSLTVNVPALIPGEFVPVVVEWDQPYVTGAPNSGGATSEIDVCLTGVSGNDITYDENLNTAVCTGPNAKGADPVQIMIIGNPANAAGNSAPQTVNIMVGLAGATIAPGRIKVAIEGNGAQLTVSAFPNNTVNATLQGHPGAAGGAAVGAAFFFDTPACLTAPAMLEPYSSQGGAPILFDVSGTRLATPVLRWKPDFVGPDGGNDTFLGFTLASDPNFPSNGLLNTTIAACQNHPSYPNFFGTSAATPHVASIAALMLQANPALTPAQIYLALRNSAVPMGATSPNYDSGYGFVQADAAFALTPQVVPPAPTVTLAPTAIFVGSSTTITWASVNANGCTATGSWSQALGASGSMTLTPTAAGTDTYTLTCANAVGSSVASSATLTVASPIASPPSHGGGGGGLDVLALLGLAGVGVARIRRLRPRDRVGIAAARMLR
jgi:subtilisin family serine protease